MSRSLLSEKEAALRQLLAGYLACPLGDLRFELGPLGKPRLLARNSTDLRFNVSHSGELVQLAFSRRREVGVDVEQAALAGSRHVLAVARNLDRRQARLRRRAAGAEGDDVGARFGRASECAGDFEGI